ncbi:MAG: hypothetical protein DMG04_27985 [Acidobacteria bacterium]|nr:MAG: hypothetical protein DMG04_27985 [Acidobacteriota bacterium]PYQ87808.1 MAG: hypothetical protein DMG02_19390 [Acidobacteriota bacterium]PYQ88939.1 MAG: hypothetical protein DMG03_02835 [Acidobacteriota bacterium]PYR07737.1 MAG: hypothetical protein DMF99_21575 [Acidobacteriota bacterium]
MTLAAQTPANQQYGKTGDKDKGHEVTVTGCLSKGADGNFMLMNARAENKPSTTTGTSGTTTTTPPASGSTSSSTTAMTWKLEGGTDLDKHVGHKIEVTGRTDWTGTMDRKPGDTTASAAPTTTEPANPNPTTTTAGTSTPVGTSGATTDEQRYPRGARETNQPKLEVTSVKMISSSCQ